MPNKSIPTIGLQDWGIPLNNHLSQLQNPSNGGINKFEQFSGRPTNLTADDVGKTYLYTQTGNLHQWTGNAWKVLNESVINVKDYGAVGDGIVDDTAAIQFCIDNYSSITLTNYTPPGGRKCSIFFPNARYRITSTINLTSTGADGKLRHGTHLEFELRNASTEQGTLLVGETGEKPIIETTGSDGIFLENVGMISASNSTNESRIGILHARPAPAGNSAFRHVYENLYIRLTSQIGVNGGLGSIGLINIASEETNYHNLEVWANTAVVVSDTGLVEFTNKDLNGRLTYQIKSAFGFTFEPHGSTTGISFGGDSRLISWDYFSPIVLFHGSINQGYSFDNVGFIKFLPSQQGGLAYGPSSGDGFVATGKYCYAIETSANLDRLKLFGQMEGCSRFMLLKGTMNRCDIELGLAGWNNNGNFNDKSFPYIALDQKGINNFGLRNWIRHSKFKMTTDTDSTVPFLGFLSPLTTAMELEIANCEFEFDSFSTVNLNNKYDKTKVQKGIFRNTVNSIFKIIDKEIKIGENSLKTSINKKSIPVNSNISTKILEIELPTIVTNKASFGGSCEISGVCTSAGVGLQSQSSVHFKARFSFVTENSDGSIQLSPITIELDPIISFNPAYNAITSLGLSLSSANNTINLNSQPTESGNNNIPVNISADVNIHYSDAFLDNIVVDF
jgi:hypothetical protein